MLNEGKEMLEDLWKDDTTIGTEMPLGQTTKFIQMKLIWSGNETATERHSNTDKETGRTQFVRFSTKYLTPSMRIYIRTYDILTASSYHLIRDPFGKSLFGYDFFKF